MPGIRVAVHLEDVIEQAVVSPVLYSDGHAYNYLLWTSLMCGFADLP